jgi:hypothetical protein
MISRRDFFNAVGSAWALSESRGMGQPVASRRDRNTLKAEIRRRAIYHLHQRRLVVDYYRIRRQLVYPLPVPSIIIPSLPVPSIRDYPWSIWMTWQLEERVNALGWAAEWFHEQRFANCAAKDLEALAGWPKFYQYAQPDLASGHVGRLLWTAYTKWHWLSESLRVKIRSACLRHVEQVLPLSEKNYSGLRTKEDVLALPQPYHKLHNIPLIGTLGAALTASVTAHPGSGTLNRIVLAIVGAALDLRAKGYTEGVSYDGYIFDFVADWLEVLPHEERKQILRHPNLKEILQQSYMLGAPAAIEDVAELGDVEPQQMPFHFSAQAKLARFEPDATRSWYLQHYRLDWMRSDALAALTATVPIESRTPPGGPMRTQYATVLRSGWERKDLAVVMSSTNSPAGHLQLDNGTIVAGTRGRWVICDPGYQQYMSGSERDFTIGPTAHNYPVINGATQVNKSPRFLLLDKVAPAISRMKIELAECYPQQARIHSVIRSVWLSGFCCVVVADQVQAEKLEKISYHWHLHPEAAVWVHDGWVLAHFADVDAWFTCPQAPLSDANILRLPGSRGQLTIAADVIPAPAVVWWIFAIASAPPRLEAPAGGNSIKVMESEFHV